MNWSYHFVGQVEGRVPLRELALHLLDVLENAVRAQATAIQVTIALDAGSDRLSLCVEDDGPGLPVAPENALDPFYTTKKGKRTGLGLSLFKAAAELTGGELRIEDSELGGVKVYASFGYSHLDRAPLGDVAESVKTLAVSNPDIVWICTIEGPGGSQSLILQELILEHPDSSLFTVVDLYACQIREALTIAGINTG